MQVTPEISFRDLSQVTGSANAWTRNWSGWNPTIRA